MANCTVSDVKAVVDTGLSDEDIERCIADADEELDSRGVEHNKRQISRLIAASLVAMRDDRSRLPGETQGKNVSDQLRQKAEELILKGEGVGLYQYNEEIPYEGEE